MLLSYIEERLIQHKGKVIHIMTCNTLVNKEANYTPLFSWTNVVQKGWNVK